MDITEKDLEDLLFRALLKSPNALIRRGFRPDLLGYNNHNKVYWQRQVDLRGYGRADMIGYSRYRGTLVVDIIELKNVPVVSEDFNQLMRYKVAVAEIIQNSFKSPVYPFLNTYLIAPSIQDGHYLHNCLDTRFYSFDYSIEGITFHRHSKWHNGNGDLHLCDINRTKQQSVLYRTEQETAEVNEQK